LPRVIVDLSDEDLAAVQRLIPAFGDALVMMVADPEPQASRAPSSMEEETDTGTASRALGVPRCTLVRWFEENPTLGNKIGGRWRVYPRRVRASAEFKRYREARH